MPPTVDTDLSLDVFASAAMLWLLTGDGRYHWLRRTLQDCLTEASAVHLQRRADVFERAAPRPGEHLGGPVAWDDETDTAPDVRPDLPRLSEAWRRCTDTAEASRHHAELLQSFCDGVSPEVDAYLSEVAA